MKPDDLDKAFHIAHRHLTGEHGEHGDCASCHLSRALLFMASRLVRPIVYESTEHPRAGVAQ